ncbi:hypothetical protein CAEBREN_28909 [Caenorhabditis brenneri]|uniref:Uncharacterized protein n=1 Tax=Caenorhabditis brenneri TaxID=135651 RepID=G0ML09_CAEBE|nr:hypothetical protein CAEBREN_28909 [Caenorhabditis brenneri]
MGLSLYAVFVMQKALGFLLGTFYNQKLFSVEAPAKDKRD